MKSPVAACSGRVLFCYLLFAFVLLSACEHEAKIDPVDAPKTTLPDLANAFGPLQPLTVTNANGAEYALSVYVAQTRAQQARGLMYVRQLPAEHGMLFVHPYPQTVQIWMKNTEISLDILFIDQRRRIVHIETGTTPHSERRISSTVPVSYVLEVNAGTVACLGLDIGDFVDW